MTLTTMGADFFPLTPEGRLLGLLLAIYGFAVFGYVTASIASFFVARDAEEGDGELAAASQRVTARRAAASPAHSRRALTRCQRACALSENSSTILALKSSRSFGLRLVTRPWSVTTDSSTHVAPAFVTSVRIEG